MVILFPFVQVRETFLRMAMIPLIQSKSFFPIPVRYICHIFDWIIWLRQYLMLTQDRAIMPWITSSLTVRIHFISSHYNMWFNNIWTYGKLVRLLEAIIFFLNINHSVSICLRYVITFQYLFYLSLRFRAISSWRGHKFHQICLNFQCSSSRKWRPRTSIAVNYRKQLR